MGRKVAREPDKRRWGWDLGLRRILPGLQDGELVVRLDYHTILQSLLQNDTECQAD